MIKNTLYAIVLAVVFFAAQAAVAGTPEQVRQLQQDIIDIAPRVALSYLQDIDKRYEKHLKKCNDESCRRGIYALWFSSLRKLADEFEVESTIVGLYEDPLIVTIETDQKYPQSFMLIRITSKTTNIKIDDIVINRGNCTTVTEPKYYRGKVLKFSHSLDVRVYNKCQVLEVLINSNNNNLLYTFK